MAVEPRYNAVVDTVARKIVSGRIPEGAVLGLAQLQEDFGISRTVAREVMRMLEQVGMVAPQRSVGLVVLPASSWAVLDARVIEWRLSGKGRQAQLRSLTELRAGVEPVAAAAAARNASPEQRALLVDLAQQMSVLGEQGRLKKFTEVDIAFHALLLTASGNEIFVALKDVLAVTLTGRLRHGLMPSHPKPEVLEEHNRVARAVCAADPVTAHDAMVEMLSSIRMELFPE